MTDTEYSVISTPAQLAEATSALAAADGPVAVDVERASGFRYSQRAYLIQVFRRGAGAFLIDPIAFDDLSSLQAAIGDAEWVFHAASQDLPSLREIGLVPPRIFDTELTSRLLGRAKVGLAAVTEDTIGIVLKKEHSAADWSTRPLPQAWLEYAALDVLHLLDVRDVLERELAEAGKTVGQDTHVVTKQSSAMFMQFQPAAETVREDFVEAGRNLGRVLLRRIAGETTDLTHMLHPRFDWDGGKP